MIVLTSMTRLVGELLPCMREQEVELMVLMGGFAPQPINDIWVTDDGVTW